MKALPNGGSELGRREVFWKGFLGSARHISQEGPILWGGLGSQQVARSWAALGRRRPGQASVAAQSSVRAQLLSLVFQALVCQALSLTSSFLPCPSSWPPPALGHLAIPLSHASMPLQRLFALLGFPFLTCRDNLCERAQHQVKLIIGALKAHVPLPSLSLLPSLSPSFLLCVEASPSLV